VSTSLGISVQLGDLTVAKADVIVNAANPGLLGGGGVDGAIHAAGGPEILAACREVKRGLPGGLLPRGQAVIHTAGPLWSATEDRSAILASCYAESLRLSADLGAQTVAFPAISAGVYGWPLDDAARIAIETVRSVARGLIPRVQFVLFNRAALTAFRAALER